MPVWSRRDSVAKEYWQRNVLGYTLEWIITKDGERAVLVVNRKPEVVSYYGQWESVRPPEALAKISISLGGWFRRKALYIGPGEESWAVERVKNFGLISTTAVILKDCWGTPNKIDVDQALRLLTTGSWHALSWPSIIHHLLNHQIELDEKTLRLIMVQREEAAYQEFLKEILTDIRATTRFIKSKQAKSIAEKIKFFMATTPKAGWDNSAIPVKVDMAKARTEMKNALL